MGGCVGFQSLKNCKLICTREQNKNRVCAHAKKYWENKQNQQTRCKQARRKLKCFGSRNHLGDAPRMQEVLFYHVFIGVSHLRLPREPWTAQRELQDICFPTYEALEI